MLPGRLYEIGASQRQILGGLGGGFDELLRFHEYDDLRIG
jgi:hypothetical protein